MIGIAWNMHPRFEQLSKHLPTPLLAGMMQAGDLVTLGFLSGFDELSDLFARVGFAHGIYGHRNTLLLD